MRMIVRVEVAGAADARVADREAVCADCTAEGSEVHSWSAAARPSDNWIRARIQSCSSESHMRGRDAENKIPKGLFRDTNLKKAGEKGGACLQHDWLRVLIFQFHFVIMFDKRGAIDDVDCGGSSCGECIRAMSRARQCSNYREDLSMH
jgi:hypothetical protein